ncbi:MAG: type IX secretion system membrane protein PorP/SprF [Flavobacteriales bacterium]|nr:type IX secretion system membrane protein PorP/SprF [Flavobacteriales bacterium]
MRHILLVVMALLAAQPLVGQQLPQLSQYPFNDYLFNPAVAGSRPWFEMRSGHRYQWVGITDAPRTFTLSMTTPLGSKMGLGGFVYTDNVGPTRRTGMQGSYAYHLGVTEEIKLSLALSFGAMQYVIDGGKITFNEGYDPLIDSQLRGRLVPDATFGFLLYHDQWWVGASVPQLLQNKVYYFDAVDRSLSELEPHVQAMGGYRFQLGDDFRLEPQFLLKYVDPVPMKVDLTVLLRYRELLWLGGTYRTNDAFSAMVGLWFKQAFQFGYSYDLTTTNLRSYSDGTHEVMLAVTFARRSGPRSPGVTP